MKYKWNYLEILQNMRYLKDWQACETNPEKLGKIQDSLENYEFMLSLLTPRILHPLLFLSKEKDESLKEECLTESEIQIIECLLSSKPIVDSFLETEDSVLDFPVFYSQKLLISYTKDFLKSSTTPEIYQCFLKLLNEKNHIYIRPSKNQIESACGFFLYDVALENRFVCINQTKTYLDFLTLSHELFHTYYVNSNYRDVFLSDMFYTKETEGCFSDFINTEYFKTINPEMAYLLRQQYFISYQLSLEELESKYFQYRNIRFKKEISQKNFSLDIPELILSTFSYLIALDLFEIYKLDRNKSFELLGNLRNISTTEDVFQELRKLKVHFIDDDFKNLKQLKKCLEMKKI